MTRLLIALVIILVLAGVVYAATVTCPVHTYATCFNTYESKQDDMGHTWYKYECSCGDKVWVKSE